MYFQKRCRYAKGDSFENNFTKKKKKFFSQKITTEELAFGDICFEHPLASDPPPPKKNNATQ